MKRNHTALSFGLGVSGICSIFAEIMLLHILPPNYSSWVSSAAFILPVALLLGSIKSMRPSTGDLSAEYEKRNAELLRYSATYCRLIFGLILLAAFGVFGSTLKINTIESSEGKTFIGLIALVFLVAALLTFLDIRTRRKNSVERLS